MRLSILLLQLLLCLATPNTAKFVGNVNDEEGGTITILDIQDDNKTQYLNQNFEQGNYNYGYDIKPTGPVGQFHHENKSPEDVVYGCYGYEGPDNKNYMTFYISDAWGFRPVRQEQDTEIFYPADNPEGHGHHNGRMTRWADLVFPDMCAHFAERIASSTNVVTKTPQTLASPPPSSVVTKLQSGVTPASPFSTSSQGSSLTTSSVPSSSFDVIQFSNPTGTSGAPLSRLTSANTATPSRGTSPSQQPQSSNSVFDRTTNNRFGPISTTSVPNAPASAGVTNRNSPFPSTASPSLSTSQFSNNGPISPNANTGTPAGFSRPIPSQPSVVGASSTLNNVNQPSSAGNFPTTSSGRPTSASRAPTGSGTSRNPGTNQFHNSVTPTGPVGQTATTSIDKELASLNRRPSSSSNTDSFVPSTPIGTTGNRFSTGNRQPTPQTGGSTSFRTTPSTPSTGPGRQPETSQGGSTNFRATTRPASQQTNSIPSGSSQTTGSQGTSSFGGSTNFRSTSRPLTQEIPTGSSQTTGSVRPQGSSSTFGGTGTSNFRSTSRPLTQETNNNIPTGSSQTTGSVRPQGSSTSFGGTGTSNFRSTSRPLTQETINNIPTGPGQTTTNGRPQSSTGFGGTGTSNFRSTARPAISQETNTPVFGASQSTGPSRQQTPSAFPTGSSSFRTTTQRTNQVGTGQTQTTGNVPTSSRGNTNSFSSQKDHSVQASRTTTSRPGGLQSSRNPYNNIGSEDEDDNVNTVPNRSVSPTRTGSTQGGFSSSRFTGTSPSSGARAPTTSHTPTGSSSFSTGRGNSGKSTSTGPGATGTNAPGTTPFATNNIPSSNSPFPRPGSGFVNNPSTLQPSSTNRNNIPTSTNGRPASSTVDNSRVTDRFTQGTGAPIVPQEPDEDTSVNTHQPTSSFGSTRFGSNQETDRPSTPSFSRPTTTQPAFGARRPVATTLTATRAPTTRLSTTSPLQNSTTSGGRPQEESFCETQCSSCKNKNTNSVRDEDFSQIPGAILSNIPVIFYPDCSANAYSRPAIVPFCPSQKTQCGEPLAVKFPDAQNFIAGSAPVARNNAFLFDEASRASRKVRRGRQPRSLKL